MKITGIFIVSAKRTPFGAFGGALKDVSATELQVIANKAAIESAGIKPENVDSVFVGNVMQVRNNYNLCKNLTVVFYLIHLFEIKRLLIYHIINLFTQKLSKY